MRIKIKTGKIRFGRRTRMLALVFAFTMIFVCPLYSADDETVSEGDSGDYTLEDTVVTATKIGETNLQETPLSITVFDVEKMKNHGISDMYDIGSKTPGVTISRQASSVFIRGIGSDNPLMGGSETVGVYVDEVYMSRISGFSVGFFDLNRLEFLRGPQGTLYGRNTTGGAINLFTANPTNEPSGYVEADVFREGSFITEAAISGPVIKDKLKLRLAANYEDEEGWIESVNGGSNRGDENGTMGRLKLDFTPTDDFGILLSFDGSSTRVTGTPLHFVDNTPFVQAGAVDTGWDETFSNYYGDGKENIVGGSIIVRWNLSKSLAVKSISALRDFRLNNERNDYDGTSLDLYNSESFVQYKQGSQEFQLNVDSGRLKLVNGLYYMQEKEVNIADSRLLYDVDSILGFASPGADYSNEYDTSSDTTSMAAFTQGEFAVNDKMKLIAGLRYSYEKKEIAVNTDSIVDLNPSYGLPAGTVSALVIQTINTYTNEDNWDAWTPKFGVDYQFKDNVFLYASVTNGFKSGGFNGLAATRQQSFDPETVWAYETGFKTDWFDKRLRINTGLFYYDYTDMQLAEYKLISGTRTRVISNAGESKAYGGEIEISARPLPPLQLALGVALLETEFDNYIGPDPDDSSQDMDFSGNELPYAPKISTNASASYTIPCRGWGYLTLYANYDWRDKVWTDAANQELIRRDALGLLNARISFDSVDGKWQFQIYGKNITDEEYYEYKLRMNMLEGANSDTVLGIQGDPATYGMRVRYNF